MKKFVLIRAGHSDNWIGFGSDISGFGYFGTRGFGTNRIFLKFASVSVRYLPGSDRFG